MRHITNRKIVRKFKFFTKIKNSSIKYSLKDVYNNSKNFESENVSKISKGKNRLLIVFAIQINMN